MELVVSELAVARGGLPVLAGVSFRLKAGEALVLRGPNGIGKTTLLRTIAGLQRQLSGAISLPPETVAYAGHADAVKSVLTVAENLAFWAQIYGTGDIAPALTAFDLLGLRHRTANSLSAGQKRRLGLARLLVAGRSLWLLDEPTVSLDAASVQRFGEVLRSHLAGGGMVLLATHIDLGLSAAQVLDLAPFRAGLTTLEQNRAGFDEAFT